MEAINAKEVDPDDAYRYASEKKRFHRFVTNKDLVPLVDVGGNEKLLNG
jgi:twitching motility protein PilT